MKAREIRLARPAAAIGALFILGAAGLASHAFAQSPPGAAAARSYDGNYAGAMTIAEDHAAGQRAVFHGKSSGCAAGPFRRALTVNRGQFLFAYSSPRDVKIAGSIGGDGSLSGATASTTGYVVLTGKIVGDDLVGTVGGPYCKYSLQLRRA